MYLWEIVIKYFNKLKAIRSCWPRINVRQLTKLSLLGQCCVKNINISTNYKNALLKKKASELTGQVKTIGPTSQTKKNIKPNLSEIHTYLIHKNVYVL